MKYPTGILKNTATGRFHPISFRPAPAPSSSPEDSAERYKSLGHHTDGFDTLEAAKGWIGQRDTMEDTGTVWEWDGTDIPAMVQRFSKPQFSAPPIAQKGRI